MSRHRHGRNRHHNHGTRKIHLKHDHSHSKDYDAWERMAQSYREAHVAQLVACVAAPITGIGALVSKDADGWGFLFLASCVAVIGASLYRWFMRYVYQIGE